MAEQKKKENSFQPKSGTKRRGNELVLHNDQSSSPRLLLINNNLESVEQDPGSSRHPASPWTAEQTVKPEGDHRFETKFLHGHPGSPALPSFASFVL